MTTGVEAYQVGLGWDIPLDDLVVLNPQPRSPNMGVVRRAYVVSTVPGVIDQKTFVPLLYSGLGSAVQWRAVATQFGLEVWNVKTAKVTVYVRDFEYSWVRKNGIAVRPLIRGGIEWRDFFPRDITIIVKELRDPAS